MGSEGDGQSAQSAMDENHLRYRQRAETLIRITFPKSIRKLEHFMKYSRLHEENDGDILRTGFAVPESSPSDGGTPENRPDGNASSQSAAKKMRTETGSKAVETAAVCRNPFLEEIISKIRPMLIEQAEGASTIRMWINLSIPTIEDQTPLAVKIQEAASCLAQVIEEHAYVSVGSFSQYHARRAQLAEYVVNQPEVGDFRRAIEELDWNQYLTIRMIARMSRNNYTNLIDLIVKNRDKLERPKRSRQHHQSLY